MMEYLMKYPIRLHVRIDEETHAESIKTAEKLGISQAQLVRLLLKKANKQKNLSNELYF
jgi:antitoxin component of RelBE/YafQ-DinJ toxin-antitoxin module